MTEPPSITPLPPTALLALELWDAAAEARLAKALGVPLPPPGGAAEVGGGWRVLRVEPTVWWLTGPQDGLPDRLRAAEAALADGGAAVDLTGGFAAVRIAGAGWRELLTVGGVFDAEDPAFGPGRTAGTILHHAPVRYDVIEDGAVLAYVPPSLVEHLLHHWRTAAARLA